MDVLKQSKYFFSLITWTLGSQSLFPVTIYLNLAGGQVAEAQSMTRHPQYVFWSYTDKLFPLSQMALLSLVINAHTWSSHPMGKF